MNNILLLGAGFATGNMGVGALAAGALTVVSRRFPGASISLLDYGRVAEVSSVRVSGRTLQVPLINLRFSWKLFLANNIAALLVCSLLARCLGSGARRWFLRRNPWLAAVARSDAALAVSGGDSFSDIYGLPRFLYVALPQLLVVSLGIELIMLPQTIGPFHGAPARWIAAFLARRATLVYSRDAPGIGEIRRLLGATQNDAKARFCFDMGFVVEPRAPSGNALESLDARCAGGERALVGLNVSGLLLMGGYTRKNMFDLGLDYMALIERLVAEFIETRNADVLLVPHVFGDDPESDTAAVRTVHHRLRGRHGAHLFRVTGYHDQNEIKHLIGLCDFFVGSRMHACIAALSQSVPAVGVAYSDKFAGVFDSVGSGAMVVDPRHLTLEQACTTVVRAFDERDAERARLHAVMPRIRSCVLDLLDDAR